MALDWERITRAYVHPLTVRILETMAADTDRNWSITGFSRALGQPVPRVAHHVHRLLKLGFLREAGTRPMRGKLERFYLLR